MYTERNKADTVSEENTKGSSEEKTMKMLSDVETTTSSHDCAKYKKAVLFKLQ